MSSNLTSVAVWNDDGSYAGSMPSDSLSGVPGGTAIDILLNGLAGAASNAAWNASNTVGNAPQMTGITIGASGNLMPLLILGIGAWLLFGKG